MPVSRASSTKSVGIKDPPTRPKPQKIGKRAIPIFLRWIEFLDITPVPDLSSAFSDGLLLCVMLQRLTPGLQIAGVNRNVHSKAAAVQNIDKALRVVFQKTNRPLNIPTPEEIYLGNEPQIISLLFEIVDCFVIKEIKSSLRDLAEFFSSVLAPYGRVLSARAATSAAKLCEEMFEGAALACFLHAFLEPHEAPNLSEVYWQPESQDEKLDNLDHIFDSMDRGGVGRVLASTDFSPTPPHDCFLLLQLWILYQTFENEPPARVRMDELHFRDDARVLEKEETRRKEEQLKKQTEKHQEELRQREAYLQKVEKHMCWESYIAEGEARRVREMYASANAGGGLSKLAAGGGVDHAGSTGKKGKRSGKGASLQLSPPPKSEENKERVSAYDDPQVELQSWVSVRADVENEGAREIKELQDRLKALAKFRERGEALVKTREEKQDRWTSLAKSIQHWRYSDAQRGSIYYAYGRDAVRSSSLLDPSTDATGSPVPTPVALTLPSIDPAAGITSPEHARSRSASTSSGAAAGPAPHQPAVAASQPPQLPGSAGGLGSTVGVAGVGVGATMEDGRYGHSIAVDVAGGVACLPSELPEGDAKESAENLRHPSRDGTLEPRPLGSVTETDAGRVRTTSEESHGSSRRSLNRDERRQMLRQRSLRSLSVPRGSQAR
eukprot:Rmarinus@m.4633